MQHVVALPFCGGEFGVNALPIKFGQPENRIMSV